MEQHSKECHQIKRGPQEREQKVEKEDHIDQKYHGSWNCGPECYQGLTPDYLLSFYFYFCYGIIRTCDINWIIPYIKHIHKQKLGKMMSQFQFQPYYPHLERFLEWPRVLFLEPFSTKSEPFTEWYRQPYSFVTDDFCHDKQFVAKVNATTGRSVIKIKETVAEKNKTVQVTDEVKLWFDLPSRGSLYAKVKSSDYIKVQYDHGLRSYHGRLFYGFAGLQSSKLLNNLNFRFGLGHVSENCNTENRLKVTLIKDKNVFHWYHKTYLAYKRARFGFMTVVDLNRCVFQKNNLLFGYHFRDDTFGYLRAEVNGFRTNNPDYKRVDTIFDTVTADVIHRINNKSKAALEATFNIPHHTLEEAKVVYQFEYEARKVIKASLSNKLNFAVLAKIPLYGLEDIATLTAGIGVNGLANKDVSFKTGFELNINL